MKRAADRPLIAVSANQAWNLVNFRADLIRALVVAGCRVVAIAPPNSAMEARLAELGAEFEPLAIDGKGLSPFRDLATLRGFSALLRALRPDAFLSWTIKPNVYGALAAGRLGIPALPNVSGLGTAFIRRNLLTAAAKALYRLGFRKAPVVFFQNPTDCQEFIDAKLVTPCQARLLPGSGIDPDQFKPLSSARPGPHRFLMLSRVVADKGVREFVAAARITKETWPEAKFILMGEIGAPNRTAITEDEVQGWLAEGVIEHVPAAADVRPQIALADFIVLPSYREGLSRVLIEAGAMGRPAITTDVPGCRDIISDQLNGFLCEARSAESLAQACAKAARMTDSEWHDMAQAARQRVETAFSSSIVIERYFEALRDIGICFDQQPRV